MEQSLATIAAIRFGYGFRPGEADVGDAGQLLRQVTGPDLAMQTYPTPAYDQRAAQYKTYRKLVNRVKKQDKSAEPALKEAKRERLTLVATDMRMRFARAIFSTGGFRERLVSFWADHFTVIPKGQAALMAYGDFMDRAIRPNIGARFADMLIASTTHPSMLFFLDQTKSVGPNSKFGKKKDRGLNENLAREVLELHTLGVGGTYSQADVRQLAELLTGLVVTDKGMDFRQVMAEPGAETVLGRSYGGGKARKSDILAFLEDVAVHPDTAGNIARKLVVHFVSDDPDPALVAHVRDAFLASGGDLPAVYAALLEHPGAWINLGQKVKQPFDFIASGYRALNVGAAVVSALPPRGVRLMVSLPLVSMGQPLRAPPGPNGWPEEAGPGSPRRGWRRGCNGRWWQARGSDKASIRANLSQRRCARSQATR